MDSLSVLKINAYNLYRWGNGEPMPLIKNPLYIDVVFQSVAKYLDARSLKVCRQVCVKWNEVTTKILLQRVLFHNFYEQVHADNFESLTRFVSCNNRTTFHNLHIRGLNILRIYKNLNLIGPQVRTLKFYRTSFETEPESARELCRLLDQLPSVRCLYMDLNASTERLFYENQQMFGVDVMKTFSRLEQLQLKSCNSINRRTLDNLMRIPWQLSSFEFTIDNRVPSEMIRELLCMMNDTLTDLVINFCWNYEGYDYNTSSPKEDDWVIPIDLFQLKRLKIQADRGNDPLILSRSLVTALQLAKLQVLELYGEAVEGSFGRMVFPHLWDVQNKSLTTIKLGSIFWDTSCFLRPISIWPNLKEMTLYFPTMELLAAVFATMDGLEKLHLELKNNNGVLWDSFLTGVRKSSEEDLNGNNSCENDATGAKGSRATIRNLKGLKSLKIKFPEFSPGYYFSDFFIYHGLIHLKEIQYLCIRGEKFSSGALADLKKNLRPLASINLVKCHLYEYSPSPISTSSY